MSMQRRLRAVLCTCKFTLSKRRNSGHSAEQMARRGCSLPRKSQTLIVCKPSPHPRLPCQFKAKGPNRQGLGEAFGCTGRRNPRSASPLNQRATFRGCKHLQEDGVQFSGVTGTVEAAGRGPRSPRLGVRCC